jgi:hypothetical protein
MVVSISSIKSSFTQRQLQIQLQSAQKQRPIMYTFYAEIHDHPFNTPGGMTFGAHEELIRVWKQSWSDAGWDPRVLTEDDAKRHPDYTHLRAMVDRMDTGSYDKLCFLRWLAMSAAGGGWMGDYDVFPLHDFRDDGLELPNNGELTIHNRLCPSLVSGVENEWDRMAKRLIEYGLGKQMKTDQRTVVALYKKWPDMFKLEYSVTQHMYNTTTWGPNECETYTPTTMRAVHFAHAPMTRAKVEGKLPATFTFEQRPKVISEWLEMWQRACGSRGYQRKAPQRRKLFVV